MKKKIYIIVFLLLVFVVLFFVFTEKDASNNNDPISQEQAENLDSLAGDKELELMMEETIEESSFSKIDDNFKEGKITLDEMYTYKLIAMFAPDKLQEEYEADKIDAMAGDRIVMTIKEDWDKLKPETQEKFESFLLSFSDENSFFYHGNYELRKEIINNLVK